MIIFLFSTQPEVFQFLVHRLEKKDHVVHFFKDSSVLYSAVKNSRLYPDLLILDFKITNHTMQNIYNEIYEARVYLPTIFYNDPCIGEGARSIFWRSITEQSFDESMLQPEKTKVPTLDELDEVFHMVQEFVESEEFSPYIYLMQEPKPFPKRYTIEYLNEEFEKENSDSNSIYKFKRNVNLPENLFCLLQVFFDYSEESLTLDLIRKLYQNKKNYISENSIKVLISQLKKYFKENPEYNYFLEKTDEGYKFFIKR